MTSWFENDLKVLKLREKIILLTEEFNEKYGSDIESYDKKLDAFLKRKLKKESDLILREQLILTISPLILDHNS